MIDESSEFGARAAAAGCVEEVVVWMTTVTPAGTPLPRPVWFIWDEEESALVYSRPARECATSDANARVTLNFDGDGGGGDIIVFTGIAAVDPERRRRTGHRTTWRSTTSTSSASG